jgi:hypothetical protein
MEISLLAARMESADAGPSYDSIGIHAILEFKGKADVLWQHAQRSTNVIINRRGLAMA